MKQIIRLTESDLHRIVRNSVRRILRESEPISYNGKYNNMNDDGTLDSDEWSDSPMKNGRYRKPISHNGKYNNMNNDGTLESDEWR